MKKAIRRGIFRNFCICSIIKLLSSQISIRMFYTSFTFLSQGNNCMKRSSIFIIIHLYILLVFVIDLQSKLPHLGVFFIVLS